MTNDASLALTNKGAEAPEDTEDDGDAGIGVASRVAGVVLLVLLLCLLFAIVAVGRGSGLTLRVSPPPSVMEIVNNFFSSSAKTSSQYAAHFKSHLHVSAHMMNSCLYFRSKEPKWPAMQVYFICSHGMVFSFSLDAQQI